MRLALCVLLAAALTACATVPRATPPSGETKAASLALLEATDWPSRRAALLALDHFSLKGRVAVAAGDEGFSAGLRWQQQGANGSMQLEGPLGVGAMRIEFAGTELKVTDSRGNSLAGEAARAQLERQLGFAMPLTELAYWVRGVAAPSEKSNPEKSPPAAPPQEQLDAQGQQVAALTQAGWSVEYTAAATGSTGAAARLPRKLSVQRPGYRLRLLIERWELP